MRPNHRARELALGAALFLATTLATPRLWGQTANQLDAVVAEALRNNLALAQEELEVARTAATVREARGRFLPSLSLDSRHSEQRGTLNLGDFVNPAYTALNQLTGTDRFPSDLDVTLPFRHESRLRLVQPLFDPSINAAYALARNVHEGQRFERGAAARELAADAQSAYLNVAAARAARRTLEATLELVIEGERVARRLVDAGEATPDQVYRARADRSEIEQQLAEAREAEDAAARSFNQVLRRPLDEPADEMPDSLVASFDLALSEDEAVASGLARREELAQAEAGIRTAEAGVRLASASFLPSFALAVDYGYQSSDLTFDDESDFLVGSVAISWSLFNGGQDLARRRSAIVDADRQRLRRAELEDLVELEVRQAYQATVVARGAIETASARVAAARRTFELVGRRYDEGLAPQIEFLDARTALTSAELNRVLTLHRYGLRYVDLERAAALRRID